MSLGASSDQLRLESTLVVETVEKLARQLFGKC